jgi:hypothetical protein
MFCRTFWRETTSLDSNMIWLSRPRNLAIATPAGVQRTPHPAAGVQRTPLVRASAQQHDLAIATPTPQSGIERMILGGGIFFWIAGAEAESPFGLSEDQQRRL